MATLHTLSKSDYKLARSCATKLYYREMRYPDNSGDNAYLAMLAEGGYMVEQLAKLLFPDGIALEYGKDPVTDAAAATKLLERDEVTLFEPTLLSGRKLARVDILRKRGNRFELIEVKSKSFDGDDLHDDRPSPFRGKKRPNILAPWIPYLEDVTYQVHVLRELYPEAEIVPRLLIVDKSKTTTVDMLPALFTIRRDVEVNGRVRDLDVQYTGALDTPAPREFLAVLDVSSEVAELLPEVTRAADEFVALLADDGPKRHPPELRWACRGCEFRGSSDPDRDGFGECWGTLGRADPHVFELYKFGANNWSGVTLADVMIQNGMTSLYDVDPDKLVKADGGVPASRQRQLMQIEHTRSGEPWIGDGLAAALQLFKWPLHFIDFETSQLAVPYHAGMRPYGKVVFQWSCHTLTHADAEPTHRGWLNTEALWPNLEFARTLRDAIGNDGQVLTWSAYETSTLRSVRDELLARAPDESDLIAWITDLIGEGARATRIVDLNALCLDQFFVPGMQGRTSIKVVLDALWKRDPEMRARGARWMADALCDDAAVGPYEGLPGVMVDGEELNVADGTGAMRAYQAMLYGAERHHPELVNEYRNLLDRYCKLDTLAMVLIWDHWHRVTR